jgi:hypothetical protein
MAKMLSAQIALEFAPPAPIAALVWLVSILILQEIPQIALAFQVLIQKLSNK